MTADSFLAVASILAGFAVTVLMFRIQRELQVRKDHPDWPTWVAWADYLVFGTIVLSLIFVVLLLVVLGKERRVLAVAAGSCAAAAILMTAYPFAILDHYRIGMGLGREGGRKKGEPIEKVIVVVAYVIAALTLCATAALRWSIAV
ncbi:MAG TPA: hypothetical protein VGW58_03170 [Pyrinomonadaceae bacterium]|nr:hypothetical protein [Pyrinomonadaceae bacterium]